MPYVCKFCKGKYCAAHRLPENHDCQGLGAYREKMREQGRIMPPDPAVVEPTVSPTARAGMGLDALWTKAQGRMTYVFMGLAVAVFLLQLTIPNLTSYLVVDDDFLVKPWTVLTSVFAHASFNHLFVNMLVLLFFGTSVERLIGTKRFTYLFLAAGAVAGVAQIVITQVIFGGATPTLGASGAIQGVMGTLVVLAPRLTVLVFFVIPAPLWALMAFYILFDLLGAFAPGSQVAHFAHLGGLAVGAWYGWRLKQQGLRAQYERPPPMRRFF